MIDDHGDPFGRPAHRSRARHSPAPLWPGLESVVFVGSFPPRRCGIASFTADLSQAVRQALRHLRIAAIAVDPAWESFRRRPPYPGGVDEVYPVRADQPEAYVEAGRWIERRGFDVLNVQHEYGLFGGQHGEFILRLVRETSVPMITTLHTVLRRPDEKQRQILVDLAARSRTVVVQARSAVDLLERVYGIDTGRVMVIPHGTPNFPRIPGEQAKARFGFEGRPVLLTYGLLSPGKGIEQAIQALPAIARRFASVLYVVAGQTHPNVLKLSGESYREQLAELARHLGVEANVQFIGRYLALEELGALLSATDVYVVPYPNEDQAVSGTLSYALAAGKAVVSTPFRYAREVVGPGRGLLCRFGDPESLASEVIRVLENEDLRRTLEHRARAFGQSMSWDIVGARYGRLFGWVASQQHAGHDSTASLVEMAPARWAEQARGAAQGLGGRSWQALRPGR
ncbi:MAG: glycosyltransferase family 4 protein [Bacillota bacterium]